MPPALPLVVILRCMNGTDLSPWDSGGGTLWEENDLLRAGFLRRPLRKRCQCIRYLCHLACCWLVVVCFGTSLREEKHLHLAHLETGISLLWKRHLRWSFPASSLFQLTFLKHLPSVRCHVFGALHTHTPPPPPPPHSLRKSGRRHPHTHSHADPHPSQEELGLPLPSQKAHLPGGRQAMHLGAGVGAGVGVGRHSVPFMPSLSHLPSLLSLWEEGDLSSQTLHTCLMPFSATC